MIQHLELSIFLLHILQETCCASSNRNFGASCGGCKPKDKNRSLQWSIPGVNMGVSENCAYHFKKMPRENDHTPTPGGKKSLNICSCGAVALMMESILRIGKGNAHLWEQHILICLVVDLPLRKI